MFIVDSCVPGDYVRVSGIVKVVGAEKSGNQRKQKDKCLFSLYIQANSITNGYGNKRAPGTSDKANTSLSMEFTTRELYAVEEIQGQHQLFRLIVG